MRSEPREYSWLDVKVRKKDYPPDEWQAEVVVVSVKGPGKSTDQLAIVTGDDPVDAVNKAAEVVDND